MNFAQEFAATSATGGYVRQTRLKGTSTNIEGASASIKMNMTMAGFGSFQGAIFDLHIKQDTKIIDPVEGEFQHHKKAFNDIPPLLKAEYQGKFVVSRNGEILDSDENLMTLMKRFFSKHGDISAYIDKIGETDLAIMIDTPFFD